MNLPRAFEEYLEDVSGDIKTCYYDYDYDNDNVIDQGPRVDDSVSIVVGAFDITLT